jgi:hypothetical protein
VKVAFVWRDGAVEWRDVPDSWPPAHRWVLACSPDPMQVFEDLRAINDPTWCWKRIEFGLEEGKGNGAPVFFYREVRTRPQTRLTLYDLVQRFNRAAPPGTSVIYCAPPVRDLVLRVVRRPAEKVSRRLAVVWLQGLHGPVPFEYVRLKTLDME